MTISSHNSEGSKKLVSENLEFTKMREKPTWVVVSSEGGEGKVLSLPTRDDVSVQVDEQMIIEFCSR
jgi:small subunit ribosomal protein S4